MISTYCIPYFEVVLLFLSQQCRQDPDHRTHFSLFVLQVRQQCNFSNHFSLGTSVGQQVAVAVDIHKRVGTIDGFIFVLLDHRDIRRSSDCSFQRNKS